MKKLIAILMCLMIGLLPAQAMASEFNVLVPSMEGGIMQYGVGSSCTLGDTLYMIDGNDENLIVHALGEKEAKVYSLTEHFSVNYDYARRLYIFGSESLMLLEVVVDYSSEEPSCVAKMYGVELADDGLKLNEMYDVDWEFMRDSEYGYFRYIDSTLPVEGGMLFSCYDDYGDKQFYIMDSADGSARAVSIPSAVSVVPYTDGRLLVQQYDYEVPNEIIFAAFDPETDTLEELSVVEVEEYQRFMGLACNPGTGEVYCAQGGEIFPLDIMTGELGAAVSDMPLDVYGESVAIVLPGNYYAYASYEGYALRCLDKDQPQKRTLRICDTCYAYSADQAFYSFCNERGDVTVINKSDFDVEYLVDYMMSQDATMDVYIVRASYEGFEAVFNRGYIAPFAGSEVMADAASRIEPALLERLSVDGEFAVLPVDLYFSIPSVNTKALEKLGLTTEDVPTNWADFLDFLLRLQNRMPQDGSVRLFDPYTSAYYARYMLFNAIFETYQVALRQDHNAVSRQEMTAILEKLDQIDFARLGQPTEDDLMRDDYVAEWNEDGYLLNMYAGYSVENISRDGYAMVMALTPSVPAYLPVEASVAFINPYSKNKDLAVEYIETLWELLGDAVSYCLRTDKTEPTLNSYHEDNIAWWEEYIQDLKDELAEAEPADVQMIQEELTAAEESYEIAKTDIWNISEADIEWISGHRAEIVFNGTNWLYSDDDGAAYALAERYIQGQMSADQFMREVDGKIRMMLMEGY